MRRLLRIRARLKRWLVAASADAYLLYTATLVPVVTLVALAAQRPGELGLAALLSIAAVLLQAAMPRVMPRRMRRWRRAWSLVRLAIPLFYVAGAVQLVGGPALPLLALFIPMVAGAAAVGAFHGWITAGVASAIFLLPALDQLGTPAAVALRAITLAGVGLIMAFGVRRVVHALELTASAARTSASIARRQSRQLTGLDAVGRLLATAGPSAEVLGQVLEVVSARLGYPYVSIYLGDDERMLLVGQHGYPEALATFDPRQGVAGRVMRSRSIALVPDVAADRDYVPGTIQATSLISAPLVVDGALLGLLNVETTTGKPLDATDRVLVGMVAGRLAAAVALGRERQALQARAEMVATIERFGREVVSTLEITSVTSKLFDALVRVVPADGAAIVVRDAGTQRYVVASAAGDAGLVVGDQLGPGSGPAGRAIATSEPIVDVEERDGSARTVAAIPLIHTDGVVGVMTVARDGRDAFSPLAVEALRLLASSAALAVGNAFLHAEVRESAIRDALTGLYNRRHFEEALDRLLAARARDGLSDRRRPLSAIMFDLDHFGAFNKEHGHETGDIVLRAFGQLLAERFRAGDLVARLGGEEFVVILDGADLDRAVAIADEVRRAVQSQRVSANDLELSVTVSAGCAELDAADPTRLTLLRRADVALSMAKRSGRDRVVAA